MTSLAPPESRRISKPIALGEKIATLKDAGLTQDSYVMELEIRIRELKVANTITKNTDLGFTVTESVKLEQENNSSEARFRASK